MCLTWTSLPAGLMTQRTLMKLKMQSHKKAPSLSCMPRYIQILPLLCSSNIGYHSIRMHRTHQMQKVIIYMQHYCAGRCSPRGG